MRKNWKLILGIVVTVGILLAQQPVQLQTVNGGGAVALGHGMAAAALRVELPTDGTGIVGLVAGTQVNPIPQTASTYALTRYHSSSAAAANVKASAGNLYGLVLGNSGTIPCWLQVVNTAGTPTAGTSVVDSYMVQAGVTVVVPPGVLALTNYGTGIGVAGATTDGGATNSTYDTGIVAFEASGGGAAFPHGLPTLGAGHSE